MSVAFPPLRVGDPLQYEAVVVFPLFADAQGAAVEYRLADEALAEESLAVEEVSEAGSVPFLLVKNQGAVRVLFLEGEELVGAKQNRILNTSVLVAANSQTKIPVSCVEQGRWHYKSRSFGPSGFSSPAALRYALKESVTQNVKLHRGHTSDQLAVWEHVAMLNASHGVSSDTAALNDAFETHRAKIAAYQHQLKYADGATGMVVGVGNRIVSLDLFDKPDTCRKVWDRLLSGHAFDALTVREPGSEIPCAADVIRLLQNLREVTWQRSDPLGQGEDYRAESGAGDHASALVLHGALVHCNLMTAV